MPFIKEGMIWMERDRPSKETAVVPPGDDARNDAPGQAPFGFDQLGVRVPAIIISPLIPKGLIDHTIYDPTSALATLERRFGIAPLTHRDEKAEDFAHLFSLATPRTDTPPTLVNPAAVVAGEALIGKPQDRAETLKGELASLEAMPAIAHAVDEQPVSGPQVGFAYVGLMRALSQASTEEEKAAWKKEFTEMQSPRDAARFMTRAKLKVGFGEYVPRGRGVWGNDFVFDVIPIQQGSDSGSTRTWGLVHQRSGNLNTNLGRFYVKKGFKPNPMKNLANIRSCCNCSEAIDERVSAYSLQHFDFTLCIPCQKKLQDKWDATTRHALSLYFLLRKKGIRAELEKCDGFKTIDIAVVDARLNIEVDGAHHNTKHDQALADLKRTYHSFQKGYYTLRIPNSLVQNHLTETAKYVADFVEVCRSKLRG